MNNNDPSQIPQLVLASGSLYRQRLLERLGIPFVTRPSGVDETPFENEPPEQLATRLALEKAKAAATGDVDELLIGSDQVAYCDGTVLGKPESHERAVAQLALCSGKSVSFYTGLSLVRPHTSWEWVRCVPFSVTLRQLTREEIEAYVRRDQPLDCAGSFKWESLGISLFQEMRGPDPTALEGLPLIALCEALRRQGYALP